MPYTYDNIFVVAYRDDPATAKREVNQHLADGTAVYQWYFDATGKGASYGVNDVAFLDSDAEGLPDELGLALRAGQFFGKFGEPLPGSEILRPAATPYFPYGWLGTAWFPSCVRVVAGPPQKAWITPNDSLLDGNSFKKYECFNDADADYPNVAEDSATIPELASDGFVGGRALGFCIDPADQSTYWATGVCDYDTSGRVVTGDLDADTFGGIFAQVWEPSTHYGELKHIERLPDGTFLVAGWYQAKEDYTNGLYPYSGVIANVFHLDTDGTLLDEWLVGDDETALCAMHLDPLDGTTFWTGEFKGYNLGAGPTAPSTVYRCLIADGTVSDSWTTDAWTIVSIRTGPDYFAIDPPPDPEPARKSWSPVVEFGLIAEIPDAADTHEFFFATDVDDGILLRSNGVEWIQITGAGTGSPAAPSPLAQVLVEGNDGGGFQVKNIADATDPQDAITLLQAQTLDGGGP